MILIEEYQEPTSPNLPQPAAITPLIRLNGTNIFFAKREANTASVLQVITRSNPIPREQKFSMFQTTITKQEVQIVQDGQLRHIKVISHIKIPQNRTFLQVDYENAFRKYISGDQLKDESADDLEAVRQLLNSRPSEDSLYQMTIGRHRQVSERVVFRLLLIFFVLFCIAQSLLSRVLILVLYKLARVFGKFSSYTPFVQTMNQLIFKCNLISHTLFSSLSRLLSQTQSPQVVTYEYIQTINIITFIFLDTCLGLASVTLTYKLIRGFLSVLKYISITLQLAFFQEGQWISGIKSWVDFNPQFTACLDSIVNIVLEYSNRTFISKSVLFNSYVFAGYLGFSLQVLLTVELSYITSINICFLYKLVSELYKTIRKAIGYLYGTIYYDPVSNITTPPYHWIRQLLVVRLAASFGLILALCTLPTVLLYYIWFLGTALVLRIFTVSHHIYNILQECFSKFSDNFQSAPSGRYNRSFQKTQSVSFSHFV